MSFRDEYHAVWIWGQSNATGQVFIPPEAAPAGLPLATIGWTPVVAPVGSAQGINTISTLVPLDVTTPTLGGQPLYWGTEIQLGKDLVTVGLGGQVGILKTSRNGSSLVSWLPAGANWVILNAALPVFKTNALAAAAGRPIRWYLLTNQGEFEALDADPSGANAWATNLMALRTAVESLLSVTLEPSIVLRTNALLAGGSAPSLAQVRAAQAVADPTFINSDDVPLGVDQTHYVTPSAVATIGNRQALRIVPRNFLASQWLTVR